MKMLKVILIAVVGLMLLSAISMVVDYYLYSWTSFIRPFGCEYKSIGTVFTVGTSDDRDRDLEQEYDLSRIADELGSNPQSKFEFYFKGEQLGVSKMYGDIKYNIRIDKGRTSLGEFTKVSFHNTNFNSYDNSSLSRQGEKPTTPNYYIEKNLYLMIDEMPLNDNQKRELKEKAEIRCSPTTRFTF